jgi:hypothetical protein
VEFVQPDRLAYLLLLPLLYFLSLPPRPKATMVTAHLAQWLEARRKLARRPVRFRWLRFVLLAAAFLAVVLAHATPRLPGRDGATDLVILLDTSASMSARARSGGSTAFDSGRALVLGLLESTPEHVDLRIGLCGNDVRVLRGRRSELRRALLETAPSGSGTVDLEKMAHELRTETTAVLTVTDGLGPTRAPSVGALQIVGRAGRNAAITACGIRDSWPLPEISVKVRIANHTEADRTFVVELRGGIATVVEKSVDVAAGRNGDLEFAVRRGVGGRLVVRIVRSARGGEESASSHQDAVSLDDSVVIELPPPPRPEIVVRAEGEPTPALRAAARALAIECGGKVVLGDTTERAGFLLMEGGALAAMPSFGVRMLSFGTAFGDRTSRTPQSRTIDWNRTHAVTAGLDLSELEVELALDWTGDKTFAAPGDGLCHVLIGSEKRPLAVLRGAADWASVHVAFDLKDSNLFKLAAFPQFVRRCFAASYGRKAQPVVAPGSLLDPAESILAEQAPVPANRALRSFSEEPTGLSVAFLILGLLLLAIRVYV